MDRHFSFNMCKDLRRHAEKVNLNSNFTIINTDDQIRLLRQVIKLESIDEKNGSLDCQFTSSINGRIKL